MKCPVCSSIETKVVDSRDSDGSISIRRRRECLACGKRFTTFERAESAELTVIKKDGRRERFSKEKIRNGILKACEKRPFCISNIDAIVDELEAEIKGKGCEEVPTTIIGDIVLKKLKTIDEVAYLRFASVHKGFSDAKSFEKAIDDINVLQ